MGTTGARVYSANDRTTALINPKKFGLLAQDLHKTESIMIAESEKWFIISHP